MNLAHTGKPEDPLDTFDCLSIVLSVLVILLHGSGIIMVRNIQNARSTRHTYIANFAIWNIFWAISNLVRYPLIEYFTEQVYIYWTLIIEGARFPFYSSMILITTDRFLQIYLHMKYSQCCFSRCKLYFCITPFLVYVVWLMASLPLYQQNVMSFELLVHVTSVYMSATFHVVICSVFVTVYAYIGKKLISTERPNNGRSRSNLQKITIPCIIVVTFFLLQTVPDVCIFTDVAHYGGWTMFLFRLDSLSNGIIYVALEPTIKMRIEYLLRRVVVLY